MLNKDLVMNPELESVNNWVVSLIATGFNQ